MIFHDLWFLIFIPFILLVIWIAYRYSKQHFFIFPSTNLLKAFSLNWKIDLAHNLIFIRLIVLLLFVVALARPQSPLEETKRTSEGVDIVLAVDASGSMAAEDFVLDNRRVNRLEVVKDVVRQFISERTSDRIGLVVFGGLAYTVCPLTTDYDWLERNLERIELGSIEDGTAIGSAISASLARLKNSKAKSKIIILLTDGANNAGKITPLEAAKAAKAMGGKIYTIGAGTKGKLVPFPVQDFWGNRGYQRVQIDMDEDTLKKIAEITNGKYFNATDTESLREIYKAIDALEKTQIEQTGYKQYKELFMIFLGAGLLILFIEILLNNTILLRVP